MNLQLLAAGLRRGAHDPSFGRNPDQQASHPVQVGSSRLH